MDSIFFYNEHITQAVIEKSTKIEDFNEFIKNSFGVEDFVVRYKDDEDDEITIKTQLELDEALNQAEAEVIFTVYGEVKEEEEEEEKKEEVEEYVEEILIEPINEEIQDLVFIEDFDEQEENDTSKDEEVKKEKGKEESKPVLKIPEPVMSILKQIGIDNAEEIANEYLDIFKNSDFIKNNTNVDKDGNIYVDIDLPNIPSLPQEFNLDIPIDVVSNMVGENASQVSDYVQDIISNIGSSLEKKKEEENKVVHHNAICDACEKRITGIRYKCVNCADYDLCEACEATNFENNTHNANHVFLKIYKPVDVHPQVPVPSFYLGDDVDQNSSSSSDNNNCWFGRRRHCGRHFGHGHGHGHGNGRGRGMMRQKVESLEDRIKQLEERFVSLEKNNNNNNKNKHNMSQEEKIERKLKRIEERKNFLLNRARKIKEEKEAEKRLAKEEEEEENQENLEQERLAKEEAMKQAKLEQERLARQKIKEADELARKRAQQMRKEFLAKKELLKKEQKQAKIEAQRDLSKIKYARQIDVLSNMGFVEEQFIDLLPKYKGNLDAILATLLA